MRASLVTSSVVHALVIGWGLVNLSAPEAFDVADVEALPVELVTLGEITQVQEGARDAPKDGPAAPIPTERPQQVPDAENIGNQERDQSTPETETQKTVEVEEARLPEPVETPIPTPSERPEPAPQPEPQPEPEPATPATEVAPEPQPREEVTPDPVEEVIAAADPEPSPEPEFVQLPDQLPTPAARPERPQAQTAKTPERRNEETPRTATAARNTESESADEVASLLNRETGSGGGAAASNAPASAGGERTTGGSTLTQSEMDALRNQIQACWSPPAGVVDADQLRVSVQFNLSPAGIVEGAPTVTKSSGNRQADESARRAVLRCGQNGFRLPPDKYDAWRVVVVNFDPSEMF